jgi:hypothetical protein
VAGPAKSATPSGRKAQPFDSPKVQVLAEPTVFAGLRVAGMPEE